MTFRCPSCSTPRALRITKKIELPPDSRSDEITLQIVKCRRCQFAALAVYEESRRGSLTGESVDHRGYYVNKSDLAWLTGKIGACPDPRNSRCRCLVHRELGRKDKSGRWAGLADIELGQRFLVSVV
jgi:hypothetical protein